jgi:hypothetical protein
MSAHNTNGKEMLNRDIESSQLRAEIFRLRNIVEAVEVHHGKLKHALRDAVAMIPKSEMDAADLERLGEIVEMIR